MSLRSVLVAASLLFGAGALALEARIPAAANGRPQATAGTETD
ncbi:hypothetical protein [Halorussus marinus]|nr:hypothetical protein [Halorussus marinus]